MQQIDDLQQQLDNAALAPTIEDRAVRLIAVRLSVTRKQLNQIENYGQ